MCLPESLPPSYLVDLEPCYSDVRVNGDRREESFKRDRQTANKLVINRFTLARMVARRRSASTVPPGTLSRFFVARWISLNSGMESSVEVRPSRQFRNFDLAKTAHDTGS